jgi:hypothetical protein
MIGIMIFVIRFKLFIYFVFPFIYLRYCIVYNYLEFKFQSSSYSYLNSCLTYLNLNSKLFPPKHNKFNKGHVQFYRTNVDDLNQLNQHKKTSITFSEVYG